MANISSALSGRAMSGPVGGLLLLLAWGIHNHPSSQQHSTHDNGWKIC